MSGETAQLLRRALGGEELCSADVEERIDGAQGPEGVALHQLMHWIQDADIRSRDPQIAEWYRAELSRLLSKLDPTAR